MEKQLTLLKRNLSNLISYTTEEKFEIMENKNTIKSAYMNDPEFSQFDVLMAITTRAKIHTMADVLLRKLRRFQTDVDTKRLARLISIHKIQMRKMHTEKLHIQSLFYDNLISNITQSLRWLRILLKHKNKNGNYMHKNSHH